MKKPTKKKRKAPVKPKPRKRKAPVKRKPVKRKPVKRKRKPRKGPSKPRKKVRRSRKAMGEEKRIKEILDMACRDLVKSDIKCKVLTFANHDSADGVLEYPYKGPGVRDTLIDVEEAGVYPPGLWYTLGLVVRLDTEEERARYVQGQRGKVNLWTYPSKDVATSFITARDALIENAVNANINIIGVKLWIHWGPKPERPEF